MDVLPELEESTVSADEDDKILKDEDEEDFRGLESSQFNTHIVNPNPQVNLSEWPSSYTENSAQEMLMLAMAENFRQQYALLYPDRKPLLLCPVNECGVQKFVSTTLRRTLLPYSELYSWEGCASFVSDYLSLELLEPAFEIPKQLSSPTWVLQTQRGTCFEFSSLLCSLLLGAGYNAYCVSGYASKEMCVLDQSRQECPVLQTEIQVNEEHQKQKVKKYSVKPPRDLNSIFDKHQIEKRHEEEKAAAQRKREEAEKLQKEQERPPPDPLLGLRVHSWVLVLSGNREVAENFFIDPLSGNRYPTTDENFLGIESIWNQQNYWVNMQDCRYGCAEMTFDMSDLSKWEFMLRGPSSQSLSVIPDPKTLQEPEVEEDAIEEQKVFEMPRSWVTKISISPQDMELRYPGGMKVIQYRKVKLEKFAPYLLKNGLVTRLTTYRDLECTDPDTVKEWFEHRSDCLEETEFQMATKVKMEHFRPGRSDALKYHKYITLFPKTEHQMDFYSQAHTESLATRIKKPLETRESFEERSDFLCHRHVVYQKKSTGSPVQMVEEMFRRDPSTPANKQIAKRIFMISENKIHVTYHLNEDGIFPSWMNFIKPKEAGELGKEEPFTSDMVSYFQVDRFAKPYKKLELYTMLVDLIKDEEDVLLRIKDSEKEVQAILSVREQEENNTELQISIYNTIRNKSARLHMEEMERKAQENQQRQKDKKLDPLAPLLARLGSTGPLTHQDVLQLKKDCLDEFKEKLKSKEKIILDRLDKETKELEKKKLWYQKKQFTKEGEDEYLAYCSDASIRIQVTKQRLTRHKEKTSQMVLALEEKLKRDPRLTSHVLT